LPAPPPTLFPYTTLFRSGGWPSTPPPCLGRECRPAAPPPPATPARPRPIEPGARAGRHGLRTLTAVPPPPWPVRPGRGRTGPGPTTTLAGPAQLGQWLEWPWLARPGRSRAPGPCGPPPRRLARPTRRAPRGRPAGPGPTGPRERHGSAGSPRVPPPAKADTPRRGAGRTGRKNNV